MGVHHRVCRYFLEHIQDYCLQEKLPPLTSIVVNPEGKVGQGFIAWDVNNLEEGQKKCMRSIGRFIRTRSNCAVELLNPEKAADVYAKAKFRGIAQELFRKALLEAYDGKCAFCGFRILEALEAAHIVPWSLANNNEKLKDIRGQSRAVLTL